MKPNLLRRVRWTADRTGTGHAHPKRGRTPRALCGVRAIDERMAWPVERWCPACTEAVEAL